MADQALSAATGSAMRSTWKEVVDPTTYQIYYYDSATGTTQWERPHELGAAPMATGWFGRGQAGGVAAQLFAEENERYLQRPARQQKEFIDKSNYHTEGADEYNIWHGRHTGQRDFGKNKEAATDRCVLQSDAGHTKADKVVGRNKGRTTFCLDFARGQCMNGANCEHYHRVPTPADDAATEELYDCFGRQRHKSHRDDMDGVGSFANPCRTLYVAGLLRERYKSNKEFEDAVWRHFGEWGELENCNVVHRISTAFPRYRLRTSAEFAKEAMGRQSLDQGEILNVKWAHDDPNPVAKEAIEKANSDAVFSILQARGTSMEQANFNYPASYSMPDEKMAVLQDGTDVTARAGAIAYPDTSMQYTAPPTASSRETTGQAPTCSGDAASESSSSSHSGVDEEKARDSEEGTDDVVLPPLDGDWSKWRQAVDPLSGASYLYNVDTRAVSWGREVHREE